MMFQCAMQKLNEKIPFNGANNINGITRNQAVIQRHNVWNFQSLSFACDLNFWLFIFVFFIKWTTGKLENI